MTIPSYQASANRLDNMLHNLDAILAEAQAHAAAKTIDPVVLLAAQMLPGMLRYPTSRSILRGFIVRRPATDGSVVEHRATFTEFTFG